MMGTIYASREQRLRHIWTGLTANAYLERMRDIMYDGALGDDLLDNDGCDDCYAPKLVDAIIKCLDNWHDHN